MRDGKPAAHSVAAGQRKLDQQSTPSTPRTKRGGIPKEAQPAIKHKGVDGKYKPAPKHK
jgi:hypothetical protein